MSQVHQPSKNRISGFLLLRIFNNGLIGLTGFLLLEIFNSGLNGLNGFLLLEIFNNGLNGFFRGCTCLRSALPLARARSAPTKQESD